MLHHLPYSLAPIALAVDYASAFALRLVFVYLHRPHLQVAIFCLTQPPSGLDALICLLHTCQNLPSLAHREPWPSSKRFQSPMFVHSGSFACTRIPAFTKAPAEP